MMTAVEVARTLVKSPPEIWAELENTERLCAWLGEISITRVEHEAIIEWEGAAGSGSIAIEQSGWGTRVKLKAEPAAVAEGAADEKANESSEPNSSPMEASAAPESESEPDTPREVVIAEPRLRSWWRRVRRRPHEVDAGAPEPRPAAVAPVSVDPPDMVDAAERDTEPSGEDELPPPLERLLTAILDDLGAAHKRPFSAA